MHKDATTKAAEKFAVTVSSYLRALPARAVQWLWPRLCLICAEPSTRAFCGACAAVLPRCAHACVRCAAALPASAATHTCGECQQAPPAFAATQALFLYRSPISDLVVQLKYAGRLHLARRLGAHFAAALAPSVVPDFILPVPLHRARLRTRGFNQSLELARPIATHLGVPLLVRGVERIHATRAQAELPRAARAKNVRNAFSLTVDLTGRRIAIVDDVMTTGETARALSRAVQAAGAAHIEVWVLARA